MKLTGGYTNYGQDIGILMLDTIFPRIPGDIGNALSYPFPVRYKVVKDAFCERIMGDQVDEELLAPFIKAAQELEAEGIAVKDVPIGVMVETPAAAVLAQELAKEAAFFSVGTNDLTQYTLAVDRQNANLGKFYDPYHPALMALLAHIAKSANEAGIWAGICGELGADPKMTEKFIEMGYKELSMAAGRILEIRKIVCQSEQ